MSKSLGNVYIVGDSYSTYEGYAPEGNAVYYSKGGEDCRGSLSGVEDTWWYSLIKETGSNLVFNDSWSGSTVSFTGYTGDNCENSSFVTRTKKYLKDGKYLDTKIDTVLVFGGTNDNWANAPIGEPKYSDIKKEDLKSFLPAFCSLLDYICNENKGLKVINITNTELKDEITDGMAEICKKYGAFNIVLKDIEKQSGHPNKTGMKQIKDQISAQIEKI